MHASSMHFLEFVLMRLMQQLLRRYALFALLALLGPCLLTNTAQAGSDPLRPMPAEIRSFIDSPSATLVGQLARAQALSVNKDGAIATFALIELAKLQIRSGNAELALQSNAAAIERARLESDSNLLFSALEAAADADIEQVRFTQANAVLDEMQKLASGRGLPLWEARALALLGACRRREGNYHDAMTLHQRALELREQLGDRFGQVESLNAISTLRRRGGDLYQALDGHLKALRIAREIGERSEIAESLVRISRIYTELDDFDPAKDFVHQAIAALPVDAQVKRAEYLLVLSNLQLLSNEVDAADATTQEAISLADANGGGAQAAVGFLRRAQILSVRGQPEAALAVLEQAIVLGRSFDGARSLQTKLLTKLRLLIQLKRFDEAVELAQPVLDQARQIGDRLLERDALEAQSQALFAAGDAHGAYLTNSAFSALNQSLATTLTSRRIADLEASMKRRALEADVELLGRERDLARLRGDRQRWIFIGLVALGLALAGGLIALRTRIRTTAAMNAMLLAQAGQLRQAAQTDALTGLSNRYGAQPVLETLNTRPGGCMIMLDLDHFKRVNDDLGHAAGDAVLKAVAHRLRSVMPQGWTLARWGGEEFLALGWVESGQHARQFAELLRQAVAMPPIEMEVGESTLGQIRTPILVTASIGVSVQMSRVSRPWEVQLSAADQALYRVKDTGRNRVELMVFEG